MGEFKELTENKELVLSFLLENKGKRFTQGQIARTLEKELGLASTLSTRIRVGNYLNEMKEAGYPINYVEVNSEKGSIPSKYWFAA